MCVVVGGREEMSEVERIYEACSTTNNKIKQTLNINKNKIFTFVLTGEETCVYVSVSLFKGTKNRKI